MAGATVTIALDAMGSDRGPAVEVEGALAALAAYPDVAILLVGREEQLGALAPLAGGAPPRLTLVPAADVIGMDESPGKALRAKPRASIAVAAGLLAEGRAQALVSAGNTGAVMAACMFAAGVIEGVHRPGIAAALPGPQGPTLVCDVGANIHMRPEHYLQYAVLASCYAEQALSIERPRVGLLNVGEEEHKGGEELRDIRRRLEAVAAKGLLHFVGWVEGNHLFEGRADVVICDGFVGNTILKTAEGAGRRVLEWIQRFFRAPGAPPAPPGLLSGLLELADFGSYGGAPLLGIDGCAIVAHGRSDARAIQHAIRVARDCARRDVNRLMAARVKACAEVA